MTREQHRKQAWASFVTGLLFAIGLGLGGMTRPAKIVAFLDVTGRWDPSLMFVMAGALTVHAVVWRLVRRRPAPRLSATWFIPTRRELDGKLLGGAAVFGVGWGLGGYCPGPGLVASMSGAAGALTFAASMMLGWRIVTALELREAARQAGMEDSAVSSAPNAG